MAKQSRKAMLTLASFLKKLTNSHCSEKNTKLFLDKLLLDARTMPESGFELEKYLAQRKRLINKASKRMVSGKKRSIIENPSRVRSGTRKKKH